MFLSCRQQQSRHLICRHSSWQYTFWGPMWLVTAASYPGMDSSSPGCDLDAPLGLSPLPSHFPVTTLPLWSPPATPTEHHLVLCFAPLPPPPPPLPGSQGLKYPPILMTLKLPLLPRLLFWMPGLYIQLHGQLLCYISNRCWKCTTM